MKKNPQKNEEKDTQLKKGFFEKVWYSIDKIDKYSELSAEGLKRALKYLAILIIILASIVSLGTVYTTTKSVKQIAEYIDESVPELTYKDGELKVDSQDVIIDNESKFGKIIIDTNVEDEEKINQYINDISEEDNAIIILKNRLIMKEVGRQGTTNYNYSELMQGMNINEFNKKELVEYFTSSNMIPMYINLFIALLIYSFIIYIINTLFNILVISMFVYLATIILKLKIRYVAVFNMVVYAVTLPTILEMIYFAINIFYSYRIAYFDIMYILVTTIYAVAAIFILKSEFNKKQGEVQKIVEVQEEIKEEIEEKQAEKKKESKKDNKETKKEEKEKEQEKDGGEEPEGSNA